jgi:hypothetical protein
MNNKNLGCAYLIGFQFYKNKTLLGGVAKAKRNGHQAFRSKSVHAKPFALRAFHFNPSPATQFVMHVFLRGIHFICPQ